MALLAADDDATVHRAATAILDRSGFGRADRLTVDAQVHVTADQIQTVIVQTLGDLGVDLTDPHVRSVVASHLRAMGERDRLRLVRGADDA